MQHFTLRFLANQLLVDRLKRRGRFRDNPALRGGWQVNAQHCWKRSPLGRPETFSLSCATGRSRVRMSGCIGEVVIARYWSAWRDDPTAARGAYLDCGGRDGGKARDSVNPHKRVRSSAASCGAMIMKVANFSANADGKSVRLIHSFALDSEIGVAAAIRAR